MKLIVLTMLVLSGLIVAGCSKPETYPVSGQECGPDDPVKDISVSDCLPPTGV